MEADEPSKKKKKSSKSKTQLKAEAKAKTAKKTGRKTASSSPRPVQINNKKEAYSSRHSHVWQYYDNGWHNYDLPASDLVEDEYLNFEQNPGRCDVRAVKSGEWKYMVDFINMKQTNIEHSNHTVRKIRRVAL
jgi:hypothetical protein